MAASCSNTVCDHDCRRIFSCSSGLYVERYMPTQDILPNWAGRQTDVDLEFNGLDLFSGRRLIRAIVRISEPRDGHGCFVVLFESLSTLLISIQYSTSIYCYGPRYERRRIYWRLSKHSHAAAVPQRLGLRFLRNNTTFVPVSDIVGYLQL